MKEKQKDAYIELSEIYSNLVCYIISHDMQGTALEPTAWIIQNYLEAWSDSVLDEDLYL